MPVNRVRTICYLVVVTVSIVAPGCNPPGAGSRAAAPSSQSETKTATAPQQRDESFNRDTTTASGRSKEGLMGNDETWNDESRQNLRETLRQVIVGNVRLARYKHDDILETCRESYIQDECPEEEWETFIHFATEELHRAALLLASEQAKWPAVTDCDRLDRVEMALRKRGILLWQVSPCCDTCTRGELTERINVIDRRDPGFRNRIRGYAFFIDQNMPEMLSEGTDLSVYLGYGWISQDDLEVAPEAYEENSLGIAQEVCRCLRDEGFEVDWDGTLARKIGLSLNWQRRTLLE
jgi:uncharacterized protein DUF6891